MKYLSHFYCLIAIAIWSTLEITGKLVGAGIDPFTLTAWRFLIGGLALLPFALRQARSAKQQITRETLLRIAPLGILNVCASMLLLQLSIFYGKASLTAVIVAMNPLFVSLFAAMLLREKLERVQLFCLGLGIAGLLMIILFEREHQSLEYQNLTLGIILAVIASVTFGLYTVLTKKAVQRYGNLFTNSFSFLIGGSVLLLINLAIGKPLIFTVTQSNILFLAWLGIVVTGLAYVLYFEGMKTIGAARASVYFFLKPALASVLAYLILRETLSGGQVLGVVVIIISLAARNYKLPAKKA